MTLILKNLLILDLLGKPINLRSEIIINHINNGEIPVIAPLGIDKENFTYNINADTAAGFIAGKLKASKLLLTDVSGILDNR